MKASMKKHFRAVFVAFAAFAVTLATLLAVTQSNHQKTSLVSSTDGNIGIQLPNDTPLDVSCAGDTLTWATTDPTDGTLSCTTTGSTSTTTPASTTTTAPPETTTTVPATTTTVPATTTTLPGGQTLTTQPCVVQLQSLELGVCSGQFQTEVGLG